MNLIQQFLKKPSTKRYGEDQQLTAVETQDSDFVMVNVLRPTILIELRDLLYCSTEKCGHQCDEVYWKMKLGETQQASHVIPASQSSRPNQALFFRISEAEASFAILSIHLVALNTRNASSHSEHVIAETSLSLNNLCVGAKQSCWVPMYHPVTRVVMGEQLLYFSTTDFGLAPEQNPSPSVRVLSSPHLMVREVGIGSQAPFPPPDPSSPLTARRATEKVPIAGRSASILPALSGCSLQSDSSPSSESTFASSSSLRQKESTPAELFEVDSNGRITHFGAFGVFPFDIWLFLSEHYLFPSTLRALARLNHAFAVLAPRLHVSYLRRKRYRACLESLTPLTTKPKGRFFSKGVVSIECLPNNQLALLSHNSIRIATINGTITRLISRQFEAVDFVLIRDIFVVATFRALHCYKVTGETVPIRTPMITTPRGVAVNEHGLVYIVDHKPGIVHTFEPPGYVPPIRPRQAEGKSTGASTTSASSLPASSGTSNAIAATMPSSAGVSTTASAASASTPAVPIPPLGAGVLDLPQAVAAGGENVYVTDAKNDRVHVFDVHTHALKRHLGGLANPLGLLIDPALNVFVIEAKQIQVFDKTGMFICRFGNFGEARHARLSEDGDLFVLDYGRSEVLLF